MSLFVLLLYWRKMSMFKLSHCWRTMSLFALSLYWRKMSMFELSVYWGKSCVLSSQCTGENVIVWAVSILKKMPLFKLSLYQRKMSLCELSQFWRNCYCLSSHYRGEKCHCLRCSHAKKYHWLTCCYTKGQCFYLSRHYEEICHSLYCVLPEENAILSSHYTEEKHNFGAISMLKNNVTIWAVTRLRKMSLFEL